MLKHVPERRAPEPLPRMLPVEELCVLCRFQERRTLGIGRYLPLSPNPRGGWKCLGTESSTRHSGGGGAVHLLLVPDLELHDLHFQPVDYDRITVLIFILIRKIMASLVHPLDGGLACWSCITVTIRCSSSFTSSWSNNCSGDADGWGKLGINCLLGVCVVC